MSSTRPQDAAPDSGSDASSTTAVDNHQPPYITNEGHLNLQDDGRVEPLSVPERMIKELQKPTRMEMLAETLMEEMVKVRAGKQEQWEQWEQLMNELEQETEKRQLQIDQLGRELEQFARGGADELKPMKE